MLAQNELRIIDDLLELILQGQYEEDDRLPSENELAIFYNTPRINVRNALLKLEDMGYIYSKQGKGRFMKPPKHQMELHLTGSSSFSENIKQAGHDLQTLNLGYIKIPYDPEIYAKLQVQEEEDVLMISRLHIIDSVPATLHISYVAKSVFPQIERDGDSIQSMFSYYAEQGFTEFSSSKSHVNVLFPTSAERSLFECAPLVPLLVVESDCVETNQNIVLEYTKIIYRGDLFTYVIDGE